MIKEFIFPLIKKESWFKYYIGLNVIILVLSIIGPLLLGNVIEKVTAESFAMNAFLIALSFYIMSSSVKLFTSFFTFKYTNQMFGRMSLKATEQLYNTALQKNISFILEHSSGNISHKINNTFNDVKNLISCLFLTIARGAIMFLGYLSIVYYYSWELGLLITVVTIVFGQLIINLGKILKKLQRAYNSSKDNLFSYITDSIANVLLVKSFSTKEEATSKYKELSDKNLEKTYDLWDFSAITSTLEMACWPIFSVATVIFGSIGLINGEISIASFVVLWTVSNPLAFQLNNVIRGYNQFMKFSGTLENTLELIDQKNLEDETKAPLTFNKGDIEFKDINFSYGNDEVLKDFNLTIKNQEKLAIIGKSGAGKSTVIGILQGFYGVTDGDILIENQSIKDTRLSSLRNSISYIPQESGLFCLSVYENIAFAKPNATKKEVIAAAKLANAHEFIEKLPNGYDEIVGERGFKLSGGQKQRVAIARAILKNSPIIIMDEATSALDSHSEKLIQESLEHLLKDKTCIVIAHRLSTIKAMDRVIVLDDGEIIQDGKHSSLVRKAGMYKELWNLQQEGFLSNN